MTRLRERRQGLPAYEVVRARVGYHAAAIGGAFGDAGRYEGVEVSRFRVPEDPRVAPHPLGSQSTGVAPAVVALVGLDERVVWVLAPVLQVGRGREAHTLLDQIVFAGVYAGVKHVPEAVVPDHASGPDGVVVPGARRTGGVERPAEGTTPAGLGRRRVLW